MQTKRKYKILQPPFEYLFDIGCRHRLTWLLMLYLHGDACLLCHSSFLRMSSQWLPRKLREWKRKSAIWPRRVFLICISVHAFASMQTREEASFSSDDGHECVEVVENNKCETTRQRIDDGRERLPYVRRCCSDMTWSFWKERESWRCGQTHSPHTFMNLVLDCICIIFVNVNEQTRRRCNTFTSPDANQERRNISLQMNKEENHLMPWRWKKKQNTKKRDERMPR